MAAPNVVLIARATAGAPKDYVVPAAQEIEPLIVRADIDGSGAAGSFEPTLQVLSPAGDVIFSVPAATVAAGGSASVTWAPFLRAAVAATSGGGGFSGGASTPITDVGTAKVTTRIVTAASTTINPALPTGIQKGDLLLIFLGVFNNSQVATITGSPAGWTQVYDFGLPVYGLSGWSTSTPRACYFKVADGTEGSTAGNFTLTAAASANFDIAAIAAGFRGVDQSDSGAFSFLGFTVPAHSTTWSKAAPVAPVTRPSSRILQVFTDVKVSEVTTPPADTAALASRSPGENAVTIYLVSKTGDSAPADTWNASGIDSIHGGTMYFELVQMVLNPALTTS